MFLQHYLVIYNFYCTFAMLTTITLLFMDEIINILELFLGDSKRSVTSSGQLQFNCPACAIDKNVDKDGKYNLEININKGRYHCWSCSSINNTKGKISNLIKRYGNSQLLTKYFEEINNLKTNELYCLTIDDNDITTEESIIQLPSTFTNIILNQCKDSRVSNYLLSRGVTQDIIDRYKIGYTTNYEIDYKIRNRIIIPSYDSNNELNYWVGRDYTNNPKVYKYYNTNVNKQNIIFNESNINWNGDIILCEGPFDMISSLPNSIPLLGKVLNKNSLLYETLMTKAMANIILYMDGDAYKNVKQIYKLLNTGKLYNKIRYIPLEYNMDPSLLLEIYGKKGVIGALKSARRIHEVELLKYEQ